MKPLKIIFEDSHFLVINKPVGIVVNRAESVKEETVQDWAEKRVIAKFISRSGKRGLKSANTFFQRSGVVHRLDKETSGLMVIAKTPGAFEDLKAQFKKRQVKKCYLALVHGKMEAREGEIFLPIKRLAWDREKFGIVPWGKSAKTSYKFLSCYMLHVTCYSLLEVTPETGRTHQIRVHLKHLGHPLVGDLKYGGRQAKKDRVWCPRLFLHACFLSLTHPKTGEKVSFNSPLPQDLKKILLGLKNSKLSN